MSRRIWIGVVSGLLAFVVLAGVAAGAYHAGQRHEVTTQVVTSGTTAGGEVVHVVGGHWGWGHGPGPFIFFPFFVIGLVVLLFALTRRRRWYGPGGPWAAGYGPWGPGPGGPAGGVPAAFEDWHRRAHDTATTPTSGPPPTTVADPPARPGA